MVKQSEKHRTSTIIDEELLLLVFREVVKGYKLPLSGIHGAAHWGRVLENGLRLAESTGANTEIVKLFALLHDSRRMNDDRDPEHGARGAELARSLQGRVFTLPPHDLTLLCDACSLHTEGRTIGDITVRTCWDSDRLDLMRVGTLPVPSRLCTEAARDPAMIEWANRRSFEAYITDFALRLLRRGGQEDMQIC